MNKISLPKELLEKNTLKSLPAKEKEEYIRNILKKILDINSDGITISQIKESTGLNYSTVWHHLEVLKSTAQCKKISRGNIDIYHPFGKVTQTNELEFNDSKYIISTMDRNNEKFICFHEKANEGFGEEIVAGIEIPLKLLEEVINVLAKLNHTLKFSQKNIAKKRE